MLFLCLSFSFFFFNAPAPTEIYTLSLHDALPIFTGLWQVSGRNDVSYRARVAMDCVYARRRKDRKSTRLNSSHVRISYAVFCLKKKKKKTITNTHPTIKSYTLLIHSIILAYLLTD